jgi:hypothetical protein
MRLVEWRDENGPHRVTLPNGDNDVTRGIPYGVPWELLVTPITSERIARALRDVGIWTANDLRAHAKEARAALIALVGDSLGELLKEVR